MAYNIASLNCNGLRDNKKRKQLFEWIQNKRNDIVLLQETHSTEKDENIWKQQWGGEIYYCHGTSNSRGVAILIKDQVNFSVEQIETHDGRLLFLKGIIAEQEILLINIYGPNDDNINLLQIMMKKILQFECTNIIVAGDFNLVLDINMDKSGGLGKTHTKSCKLLKEIMDNLNLVDIWRVQHPDTKQYTWRRRNPNAIHCRLDMFLVSDTLQGCVDKSTITSSYRSDHSLIAIQCILSEISRGPGYWKLNCSLLDDLEYVTLITKVISDYCNDININDTNPCTSWEVLKMEIRKNSISYSSRKKRNKLAEQKQLEQDINALENRENLTMDEYITLQDKKNKMQTIFEEKVRGSMIRSNILNYEQGEKPSKYFFNLEKSKQSKKSIYKLKSNNDILIDNKKDILNEIANYYTKLYKGSNCMDTANKQTQIQFMPNNAHIKLDEQLKISCEGEISKLELQEALKNTKNNKSPGIDGLPYEFYKKFWHNISDIFLKSLNYSYQHNSLSINQRRGVISLLPKGNKDIHYLDNWRPITLLCCDYKLISKVLTNRLKRTLPHIIHTSQTGFVTGRYIGENVNTILQIIEATEDENIPGTILSADFTKAFDNLDWGYLEAVLKYFDFGESFIKWVNILNNNISAVVNVNGWFTPYFNIEKGARQGDPIAAYLFILCAELLGHAIRTDTNITGIQIGNEEYRISQFADETVIFLDGSETSIDKTIDILNNFSSISGLKINQSKTNVFNIGKLKDKETNNQIINKLWSKGPIDTLGIKIPITNREDIFKINYDPKIKEIEIKLKRWKSRNLSLKGKTTILKTYGISKLVYLATLLPKPPSHIVSTINQIIFNFIWDGKRDKIKRDVMINNYDEGGLNIPDFSIVCKTQQITWVKRIVLAENNKSQWGSLVKNILQPVGGVTVFKCNIKQEDVSRLKVKSNFWTDVISSWCEYNYTQDVKQCKINTQIIWLNSQIRIDNKLIYHKQCIENGLLELNQLYNDNRLLDRNMINIVYAVDLIIMEYNSIISAIPRQWRKHMRDQNNPHIHMENIKSYDKFTKIIEQTQKTVTKHIHAQLIRKKGKSISLSDKWSERTNIHHIDTQTWFRHINKITIYNVLRSFQYKLLHRIIYFNDKLLLFNIANTNKCDFCNDETDSIEHRFWQCRITKELWSEIMQWYNQLANTNMKCTYALVISNNSNFILLDFIILSTKYYIYKCFIAKSRPTLENLVNEIKYFENIEKDIAIRRNKIETHKTKWKMLATVES